jgi:hypothetical protein
MKSKGFEIAIGMIATVITWEAWMNVIISLTLALIGGALGYLGKHIMKSIIERKRRK